MVGTKQLWAAGFIVLMLTVACIGSNVPTVVPNAVDTIVAATMKAITPQTTATSLPALVLSPTAALPTNPPNFPTSAQPSATRINFLTGATTGVVSASIQPGQIQYYVLNASQDQIMYVTVNSYNSDVTLSVKTQGGTSMLSQTSHQSTWQARLPQTEDYYIGVYGGTSSENYTMSIEIPSRIKFEKGATKIKMGGKTVGGYVVAYTIFALKEQKMTVNLNSQANSVVLAIYGYTDGQYYLRSSSRKTTYILRFPATQDYIIEVVPKAGQVVNYDMEVIIE